MLASGTRLFRIYNRDFLKPDQFNHNGPRGRFDHHGASPSTPGDDPLHGVYYAAPDLSGCLVEVFGDTREIELRHFGVAVSATTRELRLLDLCGENAWNAGSVAALTKIADRELSQSWARYFYRDPERYYGNVDGVRYQNAHNDALAFALFERSAPLRLLEDMALAEPALQDELFVLADILGLFFNP
jgi:hypothetical protein